MNNTKSIKIVLTGNSSVGKTSIVSYLLNLTHDKKPTIGGSFYIYEKDLENKTVRLNIWDTAGQEQFRSLTPSYFQRASCIIVVYDLTDRQSFDSVSEWIEMGRRNSPEYCKIVLVGNKNDLYDKRAVSQTELSEFSSKNQILISTETSATTGEGIQYLFDAIIKSDEIQPESQNNDTIIIEDVTNNVCC